MNPFEKIANMKATLLAEAKSNGINLDDTISYREHYQKLLNLLSILELDLQTARYNYAVQRFQNQEIHVFDEMTVSSTQLKDDILLFQPVSNNGHEVTAVDMASLYDVLSQAYESGAIKQNMIVLPPDVNVFFAQLQQPIKEDENNEMETEIG